jgi:hypothetical protein
VSRIIPRLMVRYIRKSVEKWVEGEFKELMKMMIASHEELRSELEFEKIVNGSRESRRKR